MNSDISVLIDIHHIQYESLKKKNYTAGQLTTADLGMSRITQD